MAIKFSDITGGGIPFGNNAGRPANPGVGKLYSNGEAARLELYTATGWQNIVQEVPGVASITGTYLESANSGTITIQGTNFVSGAIASAIGTNGVEVLASSTTYNSLVQITAVFTGLSNANEPYDIKVTNPSNLFGLIPDVLYVNASPVWVTSSGSLGTFNEQVSISVSATATDSDSTITYALASGSTLPSGVTLNSSTGVISGTLPDISTNTTYSFIVNASDGLNFIPRTFSITSNYLVNAEYLVVAGGGGGGGRHAGAGGAGGMRYGTLLVSPGSTHTIIVGLGGAGSGNNEGGTLPSNGADSVFSSITSIGGGRGAQNSDASTSGGSGGGGNGNVGSFGTGSSGTSGQGNSGGNGGSSVYSGGGGGGAGTAGSTNNSGTGGSGGNGLANSITGVSVTYAGGGGGGGWEGNPFGAGGTGGGGAGSGTNGTDNNGTKGIKARNGTDGLGGGGGGGGVAVTGVTGGGGNGGSGVVIIAYPSNLPSIATIPGTLTYDQPTRSGYRVYRFTAGTGTITF